MKTLWLVIGLWLMAGLQARLPTLWWLGGLRLELVPALVAFAALTLSWRVALGFAVVAGLAVDALSAGPFGLSALAFGIATLWLSAAAAVLDRRLAWFQLAAGAVMAAAGNTAGWVVASLSGTGLLKMLAVAALSALVTPPVFLVGDWMRQQMRGV